MISFAGVPLVTPTAETLAWVRELIDPADSPDYLYPAGPPAALPGVPWRGAFAPPAPRVGVLHWPSSASRFAVGHYLADEPMLCAVRAATQTGGVPRPAELVIDDGRRAITAPMSLLTTRPLAKPNSETPGLHLLTLVDDRYRWWDCDCAWGFEEGVTTFAGLYAAAASALGITITADPVADAYGRPTDGLVADHAPLPPLLDAVAHACGQRIVRETGGAVLALNPRTSLARMRTNLVRESLPTGNGRIAGHPMALAVGA